MVRFSNGGALAMAITIVPTIWKPDHSKSGHFCLDFTYKITFSCLVDKFIFHFLLFLRYFYVIDSQFSFFFMKQKTLFLAHFAPGRGANSFMKSTLGQISDPHCILKKMFTRLRWICQACKYFEGRRSRDFECCNEDLNQSQDRQNLFWNSSFLQH